MRKHANSQNKSNKNLLSWLMKNWRIVLEPVSELAGAFTTILLVIITVLQVRAARQANGIQKDTNDTLKTTVYMQLSGTSFDIDKSFIDHPQLWPYFYGNEKIDSKNKNYQLAESVASLFLDYFDTILKERNGFSIELYPAWGNWMWDCFSTSPLLCAQIEQDKYDEYPATVDPFYDQWVAYGQNNPTVKYSDWIKTKPGLAWMAKRTELLNKEESPPLLPLPPGLAQSESNGPATNTN
ncbi:MAG TPA: hypothetical protein VK859_07520 [bacterium]|jgi:hypothetical protein|nr:hypothetical protein [bacterium]